MEEKLRVLLVDDEIQILTLFEKILTLKQMDVTTASDGSDALEKVKEQKFDVIVTDIMMPKMSGLELLDCLKEIGQDEIPVILMSAVTPNFAKEYHHKYFLTKPFPVEELVERIKEFAPQEQVLNHP